MNSNESFNLIMGDIRTDIVNKRDVEESWFEAMADAWGQALDKQANKITQLSTDVGERAADTPAAITELTAESLKMSFLSNSSHTALSSVGNALDVMARKQ